MSDSEDSFDDSFSDSSDHRRFRQRHSRRMHFSPDSDESSSSSSSSNLSPAGTEDGVEVDDDDDDDMPELEAAPAAAPARAARRVTFGSPNPDEDDGEGDSEHDNWFDLQARRRGRGEMPPIGMEGRPHVPMPGPSRAAAGGAGIGRFVAGERRRVASGGAEVQARAGPANNRAPFLARLQRNMEDELPFPLDPAPPRGGFGSSASAVPARPSQAIPPQPGPASSSRSLARGRRHSIVDMTELSSDDDLDLLDRRARRVAGAEGSGAQRVALTRAALEGLEGRLAQRQQELRERERAIQDARRIIDNPAEGAGRPRIRLGGAVLQQGARRVQYAGAEPIRGRHSPELDIEAIIGRARRPVNPVLQPAPARAGGAAAAPGRLAQWGGHIMHWANNYMPGGQNPVAGMPVEQDQAGGAAHHHDRVAQYQLMRAQLMGRVHPPPIDVAAVIAGIQPNAHPDSLPSFSNNFDLDSLRPIELNADGDVVKSKKKMGLVCFVCHERLRLSASYRNEDDRVWSLRCGHILDQKCLVKLSTPSSQSEIDSVQPPYVVLPVLDAPAPKYKKRKITPKLIKEPTREYVWKCPAKGCGRSHTSVKMPDGETWAQAAGTGAYQVYM